MAYLETLTSHNTQLQGLINKANALPDAGSGGGGEGYETCTVTIAVHVADYYSGVSAFFTRYVNGSIIPHYEIIEPYTVGDKVTVENVICNSAICISCTSTSYAHYYTQIDNDTTQLVYGSPGDVMVYNAPTIGGDSVRISIGYYDG